MESITHRELRKRSSAVLARVAGGEALLVTNRGVPVAVLSPPGRSEPDRLDESGRTRPPRTSSVDFTVVTRAVGESSRSILDDLRGDR
ncbi:MAG: type II toxin-antitoxin system Phd/YefM family antitoxin [Austwickia sp.]|nr:MAG: type II toxin-antitoxin system Phd/YefM family antitoxin [Austwickia sp.]